ncbi:MAG: hypothetical protein HZA48_04980 [Planctomycetes bacterium]|nr:hypothetical protein [Planctomycetota bacterium]
MKSVAIIFTVFIFASGLAYAGPDVIYLTSGAVVEGKVAFQDDNYVVTMKNGVIKISKDKVLKTEFSLETTIEYEKLAEEKKSQLLEEYRQKLSEIPQNSIEGLKRLAAWCGDNGLDVQRKECLNNVIKINTNDEFARKELGFTKYEGKWLTEDEYMARIGNIKYEGRWITPAEMEKIKTSQAKEKERKVKESKLRKLVYGMTSADSEKRQKAYEETVEFGKQNNINNIEPAAQKVLAWYDDYWSKFGQNTSENSMVRLDVYSMTNTNYRLSQITTRVIYSDSPAELPVSSVTIEVPEGQAARYQGSVIVPGSPVR